MHEEEREEGQRKVIVCDVLAILPKSFKNLHNFTPKNLSENLMYAVNNFTAYTLLHCTSVKEREAYMYRSRCITN